MSETARTGSGHRRLISGVLAIACVACAVLGWEVYSRTTTIHQQEQRILELTAVAAKQAKQQALAEQVACAEAANTFVVTHGLKSGDKDEVFDYENHFNARRNTCFVLVTSQSRTGVGLRSFDLYDAVKGKRFASYDGYATCEEILNQGERCGVNQGVIWLDGDDKKDPDIRVGYGSGRAGDEHTERAFLDRVRDLMEGDKFQPRERQETDDPLHLGPNPFRQNKKR